jgi:hypothetical protein
MKQTTFVLGLLLFLDTPNAFAGFLQVLAQLNGNSPPAISFANSGKSPLTATLTNTFGYASANAGVDGRIGVLADSDAAGASKSAHAFASYGSGKYTVSSTSGRILPFGANFVVNGSVGGESVANNVRSTGTASFIMTVNPGTGNQVGQIVFSTTAGIPTVETSGTLTGLRGAANISPTITINGKGYDIPKTPLGGFQFDTTKLQVNGITGAEISSVANQVKTDLINWFKGISNPNKIEFMKLFDIAADKALTTKVDFGASLDWQIGSSFFFALPQSGTGSIGYTLAVGASSVPSNPSHTYANFDHGLNIGSFTLLPGYEFDPGESMTVKLENGRIFQVGIATVPEPSSNALISVGLIFAAGYRRFRRSA